MREIHYNLEMAVNNKYTASSIATTDNFICEICLINYDTMSHKPYSLVPCGHTYCIECLNKMTSNSCPSCRCLFQNKIPNWEISKRLNSATAPSAPVQSNDSTPSRHYVGGPLEHFFSMSSRRKCKINHIES